MKKSVYVIDTQQGRKPKFLKLELKRAYNDIYRMSAFSQKGLEIEKPLEEWFGEDMEFDFTFEPNLILAHYAIPFLITYNVPIPYSRNHARWIVTKTKSWQRAYEVANSIRHISKKEFYKRAEEICSRGAETYPSTLYPELGIYFF